MKSKYFLIAFVIVNLSITGLLHAGDGSGGGNAVKASKERNNDKGRETRDNTGDGSQHGDGSGGGAGGL